MFVYFDFNIWHAAVAYFDVVTVEQFTKLMTWEKVLFCKTLKIISDFYFDISTKWRVKPNNISFSNNILNINLKIVTQKTDII